MFKYRKHMQTIQFIVGNIGGKKSKERFETILEPLQAIIQIACLTYCPIGSKLAIHNNILIIQPPGYTQQVKRWYNNDKKEDVFFLYNVFSRFNKFYKNILSPQQQHNFTQNNSAYTNEHITTHASIYTNAQLFTLLHELAKSGINNLIRTYNQTDKTHILHTLQMYKGMLDSPELVRRLSGGTSSNANNASSSGDNHNKNNQHTIEEDARLAVKTTEHNKIYKKNGNLGGSNKYDPISDKELVEKNTDETDLPRQFPSSSISQSVQQPSNTLDSILDTNTSHIDTIFIKITELYSQDDFDIIYHTLLKIQDDTQYYTNYTDGLNKIMEPLNIRIKKWVDDNIVF